MILNFYGFYGYSISFYVDFSLRPFDGFNAGEIGVCYGAFPLYSHSMIRIGVDDAAVQVVKALQPVNLT